MKKTAKKKPVKTKKNVPRILLLYDLEPEVIIPPKPISASEIRSNAYDLGFYDGKKQGKIHGSLKTCGWFFFILILAAAVYLS